MTSLGQIAYEAYVEAVGGRSVVTRDVLPDWAGLPPEIAQPWEVAASAVRDEVRWVP